MYYFKKSKYNILYYNTICEICQLFYKICRKKARARHFVTCSSIFGELDKFTFLLHMRFAKLMRSTLLCLLKYDDIFDIIIK